MKVIGKTSRVVDFEGLAIDELVGNVATQEDTLSVAKVTVSKPTSEPWLTLDYDEWMCVLEGRIEIHTEKEGITVVSAGETVFVAKGERFKPVFPVAPAIYIPICLPAFKPERCKREEETGSSEVSVKLKELHGGKPEISTSVSCSAEDANADHIDKLYHMCQKSLWEESISEKKAYFPPTFEKDGYFTHATAVASRLIGTANHFYKESEGDWICVELSNKALRDLGIVTRFEEPKPVGDQDTDKKWTDWRCPHIFGGIPGYLPDVVVRVYAMSRDADGTFLGIEGIQE